MAKAKWTNLFARPEFANSLRDAYRAGEYYDSKGLIFFDEEKFPMRRLPIDCGNSLLVCVRVGKATEADLILCHPVRTWLMRKYQLGAKLGWVTHWAFLPHPESNDLPNKLNPCKGYNYTTSKDLLEYITGDYDKIEP